MSKAVAVPNEAYEKMRESWLLPRTLMGGTRAMRLAGAAYLPQEPAESKEAYDNRLQRSTLFNAFRRTVRNLRGKVFSKPVAFAETTPEDIVNWNNDIDLSGRKIDDFARDVFEDGIQVGLSHILVDLPSGSSLQSRADEVASGRRPYFVHIKAEDLIGWRSANIDGKQTLTQIRFRERVMVEDGAFAEHVEERIKVVWRDKFAVFQKDPNQKDEWTIVDGGFLNFDTIPLATFYASRTGFMTAEPPLEDLAHLNAAHWQSASDQRHILHVARVPILFGAGVKMTDEKGNPIVIGPNRMINSDEPNASLEYVEHGGQAITAGRQDLHDLEDRMRVMGLELFMPSGGTQTATGKMIDSTEHNSGAKSMALSMQNALATAYQFMIQLGGVQSAEITPTLNTDFGITQQGAQELRTLLDARLAGEISRETFWSELKRRNLLLDDFDPEAEANRLDNEEPALGTLDDDELDDEDLDDE